MVRSRRTPAMLVGRCVWELSGRKLQRKIKKSQAPSEADLPRRAVEGSAVRRTSPGNAEYYVETELSSLLPGLPWDGAFRQQPTNRSNLILFKRSALQSNHKLHRQKARTQSWVEVRETKVP